MCERICGKVVFEVFRHDRYFLFVFTIRKRCININVTGQIIPIHEFMFTICGTNFIFVIRRCFVVTVI